MCRLRRERRQVAQLTRAYHAPGPIPIRELRPQRHVSFKHLRRVCEQICLGEKLRLNSAYLVGHPLQVKSRPHSKERITKSADRRTSRLSELQHLMNRSLHVSVRHRNRDGVVDPRLVQFTRRRHCRLSLMTLFALPLFASVQTSLQSLNRGTNPPHATPLRELRRHHTSSPKYRKR